MSESMKQAMVTELQDAFEGKTQLSPGRIDEIEQVFEQEELMAMMEQLGEPEQDDCYDPPVRTMSINVVSPAAARKSADRNREKLLDSDLSEYEKELIANDIAQSVSVYGGIAERREELRLPESNKTKAQTEASLLEHNALTHVLNDKLVTAHQTDNLNSTVMALSRMHNGKLMGQPIDVEAYKESMEKQMDELVASGTAREKRVAQLVIMAQQSVEALVAQSANAPTIEAMSLILEKSSKIMHTATKMLESLDGMATPKAGRLVEHMPDPQLPNKPSEPTFETE